MPFFDTKDGLRLYYEHIPNKGKPTLVFVHGLGIDSTQWLNFSDYFRDEYAILYFDLRGHGKSSRPENQKFYEFRLFSEDLKLLLQALGIKNFYFIGFSIGGFIISEFIENFKLKPKGFVLISTPVSYNDVNKLFVYGSKLASRIPKLVYKILDDGYDFSHITSLAGLYIKTLARASPKTAFAIVGQFKRERQIKPSRIRHLVIIADKDEIIHDMINGLYAPYTVIKGTHYAPILLYEKTERLIRDFLKEKN